MARTHAPTSAPSARQAVSDLDHQLMTATLAISAIGAILLVAGLTVVGTWCGVVGMGVGLGAQMMSRTRGERWVDMIGLLAAFLVVAFGASQGGLG